jgi:hypothetical protein
VTKKDESHLGVIFVSKWTSYLPQNEEKAVPNDSEWKSNLKGKFNFLAQLFQLLLHRF